MSTKCTIDCDNDDVFPERPHVDTDFHLFYECGDDDNVYLQLKDEAKYIDHNGKVCIKIPGKLWNRLVGLGELKSWAGEDFNAPLTTEERLERDFADWDITLNAIREEREKRNTK